MFLRIIVILSLLLTGTLVYADQVKIALLPVDMKSAGRYQFLGDALNSMLAGKLAMADNVELIDSGLTEKQLENFSAANRPEELFRQLKADFIGMGYGYDTVGGLKLQLVFFPADSEKESIKLTMKAREEGEIFTGIDQLVSGVKAKVLVLEGAESVQADNSGMVAFQTEHPEKAYRLGNYGHSSSGNEGGGLVFIGAKSTITIDGTVVAMDRGDLDGDGTEEFVLITPVSLKIMKLEKGRMQEVNDYSVGARYQAHAVNLADFDQDGREEIYISGNKYSSPSSGVYRWSRDGGLEKIAVNLKWYLRPVKNRRGELVLLGQRASKNVEDNFLSKNIYTLSLDESSGKIARLKPFPLPARINLFDFILTDLDGDQTAELVAIDKNEKMLVYKGSEQLLWVSEGEYGGSLLRFGAGSSRSTGIFAGNENSEDLAADQDKVYIPGRMLAVDIDGDGGHEIIVGRNRFNGLRLLPNLRFYSGGSVSCMKWNGAGMTELWKTRHISSYISAYDFMFTGNTVSEDGKSFAEGRLVIGSAAGKMLPLLSAEKTRLETYTFGIKKAAGENGEITK